MPLNFVRFGEFGEKDELVLIYTSIRRSLITTGGVQIGLAIIELISAIILEFHSNQYKDGDTKNDVEKYNTIDNPTAGHVFGYITILTMLLTGALGIFFGFLCRMINSIQMIAPQVKKAKALARTYMCFLAGLFIVAAVTVGLELFSMISFRTLPTANEEIPKHFPFSSAMIIVFCCANFLFGIVPLCGLYHNVASLSEEEKSLAK
ncbi:uncharacterized protein LOC129583503 [Paramacrobiotus metropolitanus]|uniref:uncharacterized protein LOC129583503 n=1 Tax=Paramacrobiotus metropolitanus TaxID=2943436 RepID=UPI00244572FA|nr:uncharacterized protein LOC129583503 [Paramacrobiotus metropolitanus]